MRYNKRLKLAIVDAGLKNYQVADLANQHLAAEDALSELAITRIITGRMIPSAAQKMALGRALNRPEQELFE